MSKQPEGYAELIEVVSDETAREILDYRRKKKAPVTARIARNIRDELKTVPEAQREAVITEWMNCGWTGFYAGSLMKRLAGTYGKPRVVGGSPKTFDIQPANKVAKLPENHFSKRWDRGEFKQGEGK